VHKSIIRHQFGFSLVEVMVAVGLLGITALGFATWMQNVSNQQRILTHRMVSLDMQNSVSSFIANASQCGDNLKNLTFSVPATTATKVVLGTPGDPNTGIRIFNTTTNNPTGVFVGYGPLNSGFGLSVETIQLQDITNVGTDLYQANLAIYFGGASPPPPPVMVRKILISATGSGTATIQQCGAMPTTAPAAAPIGSTGRLNNPGGNCGNDPPIGWKPVTNIGANRNCYAYIMYTTGGNDFASFGCYYDAPSGNIFVCSNNAGINCAWSCQ
jgi:prepilin-type N-terminal cleavage/methylation domain-containing protein